MMDDREREMIGNHKLEKKQGMSCGVLFYEINTSVLYKTGEICRYVNEKFIAIKVEFYIDTMEFLQRQGKKVMEEKHNVMRGKWKQCNIRSSI